MATYTITASQLYGQGILNSFSIPAASTVPTVSDPNAQAFLNAAVITDVTQANAVNSLVIGLKADGLWNNMRALYPIVGGTASTHKWNLKDPRDLDVAYRLQFNGGFTHNANGFNGNGVDGFANTYINNITIPTIGMYSRNFLGSIGSWNSDIIGEDLYATVALFMAGTLANMISTNSFVEEPFWNNPSLGIGLNTIVSDSINRTYTNGVASGTYTPLVSGANQSPMPIGIGAIITNGNVYNSNREYSAAQVAFAFVSSAVLNTTQNANLYNRVQTFQTALSRQV
jgi:hypothetical protein